MDKRLCTVLLVFLACLSCGDILADGALVVLDGEDWTFPAGTPDSAHGGLRNLGFRFVDPKAPLLKSSLVIVWWGNKMNPKPGVFDFSSVDEKLASLAAAGKRGGLYVVNWSTKSVPDWVDIPRTHPMVNPFQEPFKRAYKELIAALGKRYANDPRVEDVRMCTFTSGETLWIPKLDKERYGCEPTGKEIGDYIKEIVAAYEAAFPFEKLVFHVANVGNYFAEQWRLRGGALSNGGIAGWWMKTFPCGGRYDPLQQKLIPAYPPLVMIPEFEGRECYGKGKVNYETFRFYLLWAAALHCKYLSMNPNVLSEGKKEYERSFYGRQKDFVHEPYFTPLCRWANKNLGTRVEDAPEAFAALTQAHPTLDAEYLSLRREPDWPIAKCIGAVCAPGRLPPDWKRRRFCVNNVERFLYEDIVLDGSVPREEAKLLGHGKGQAGNTILVSRRTDHAKGRDYLCFDIDDRFIFDKALPVQIRVSYVDRGRASWRIEYDGGGPDKILKTAEVTNTDSGAIKTAVFTVRDGRFGNNLPGMIDFRIHNGGKEDITVRLVRVVRLPASQ
ncbi:MAG: hypothetical protein GXP25_05490 [Planctomycetes bacterium]|nr:hypothetical protein [Planctomycetota bacterium]